MSNNTLWDWLLDSVTNRILLKFLENDQLDKKNIQNKVIAILFPIWLLQGTVLGKAVSLIFGYKCLGCQSYKINKSSLKPQKIEF